MDCPPKLQKKLVFYPGFGMLLVVWTLLGVMTWARHSLLLNSGPANPLSSLLAFLASCYPWLLLTPLVFRLERRYPLNHKEWPRHLLFLGLAGLPLSCLASSIVGALSAAIQHMSSQAHGSHPWWSISLPQLAFEQALYWLAIGGGYLIRSVSSLHEKDRQSVQLALERAELENSMRQAELETLRMRLNPRFLFESLQNISKLSQLDPRTAGLTLTRLSDMLRLALKDDIKPETPLDKELALMQAYVAVEKMRFGDRLSVLIDIARGTEKALIPSFLLQSLVENAVRHGLQTEGTGGLIWVRSTLRPKDIILTVSDNSNGSADRFKDLPAGVGIDSMRRRLLRMYGDRYTFSMRPLPEGGTEVRIVLPLRYKASMPEIASREQPAPADR